MKMNLKWKSIISKTKKILKNNKGMSIIEIILTVAIIAILAYNNLPPIIGGVTDQGTKGSKKINTLDKVYENNTGETTE